MASTLQICFLGLCRVQRRRPGAKLKHAWQLLVCTSTDHQQQAAHRRYKYGQWLRLLQVEQVMHGMNGTRNPAHDFIVHARVYSYLAALAGELEWLGFVGLNSYLGV